MSLCFADEHLAWQQRINKEKHAATHISPFHISKSPIRVHDSRNSTPKPRFSNTFQAAPGKRLRLRSQDKEGGRFPSIYSRQSLNSFMNFSVKSSQLALSDFEGKTMEEMKEILKKERLRRLVAEQQLLEVKMRETGELIKKLNKNN